MQISLWSLTRGNQNELIQIDNTNVVDRDLSYIGIAPQCSWLRNVCVLKVVTLKATLWYKTILPIGSFFTLTFADNGLSFKLAVLDQMFSCSTHCKVFRILRGIDQFKKKRKVLSSSLLLKKITNGTLSEEGWWTKIMQKCLCVCHMFLNIWRINFAIYFVRSIYNARKFVFGVIYNKKWLEQEQNRAYY